MINGLACIMFCRVRDTSIVTRQRLMCMCCWAYRSARSIWMIAWEHNFRDIFMTETLISALVCLRVITVTAKGLQVVHRTSFIGFREKDKNINIRCSVDGVRPGHRRRRRSSRSRCGENARCIDRLLTAGSCWLSRWSHSYGWCRLLFNFTFYSCALFFSFATDGQFRMSSSIW